MQSGDNETISTSNISESQLIATMAGSSLAISYPIFLVLLIIYIFVISFAALGSFLVIFAFARSSSLRTQSNSYLVNLAVSDLLLVLLACPITLAQVTTSHWPGPPISSLCKLAMFLPLLFSFASTFSICLIAMDRHQLIVHTQHPRYRSILSLIYILIIWVLAILCASPVLPNTILKIVPLSHKFFLLLGLSERAYCMESWGHTQGK